MTLSDNTTKLFVHKDLLSFERGIKTLRAFIPSKVFLNHTILNGIVDGEMEIIAPSLALQNHSLVDTGFVYFSEQKVNDDYVYLSLESLKSICGL